LAQATGEWFEGKAPQTLSQSFPSLPTQLFLFHASGSGGPIVPSADLGKAMGLGKSNQGSGVDPIGGTLGQREGTYGFLPSP